MNALGEWLKQLILVVVLAVLADLLLPTKSMQKYVRAVMGLAVITVMLQPVLPFFRKDWADHVAEVASRELVNGSEAPSPLPNVAKLKEDMQAQADERANQLVAAQLLSGIQTALQCDVLGVVVTGVNQGSQAISVQVQLSALDADKQQDVQRWVARDLQIGNNQVHVKTGSGGE